MSTSHFVPTYPDGLPVGQGWLPVAEQAEVRFPYDGTVVAKAPVGDAEMANRAVSEAFAVRPALGRLPSHVRRAALMGAGEALRAHRGAFEHLLVLETGKPLVDCRVEVERTLLTLQTAAEEVARLHGETVPLDLLPSGEGLFGFWVRKPIGVVVGIAGYNYPLLLAAHKIAPALAAGCPVVVKPAPATPLATLWLVHVVREALREAGGPLSAIQLVTGGQGVGEALTTDRRVAAVSFTGSAGVGHAIARAAAPAKVLLELGSNSALVVAADADLDAAADAVVRGGYYASGQACISVQRVVVVDDCRKVLQEKIIERVAKVVVGDPRDEATQVSALIDHGATGRVLDWLDAASSAGASVVAGGVVRDAILAPTVVLDAPDDQAVWAEEIFGPVVVIRSVRDLDEAVEVVNASRYGLHASVFTSSLNTAFDMVDRLEVGGVVVNEVPGFRSDVMPYGGVKDSGVGREGPRFAIEELTVTRMAIIRPSTEGRS